MTIQDLNLVGCDCTAKGVDSKIKSINEECFMGYKAHALDVLSMF